MKYVQLVTQRIHAETQKKKPDFDSEVNDVLQSLQDDGSKIIDIKYQSYPETAEEYGERSALIFYEQSDE